MSLTDKLRVKMHLLKSSLPGAKGRFEMDYWKQKYAEEGGRLANDHYKWLYVDFWGFDDAFYAGKRILDIGCGPRGSLEWADMAAERVGLDSLVDRYREIGIDQHRMTYCDSPIETAPFLDGHFDVVTSINSLDHVDDVDAAIDAIGRLTKPGGTFLLLVEVLHDPTVCEPHRFDWTLVDRFSSQFDLAYCRHAEGGGKSMRENLEGPEYDANDPTPRGGVLAARFTRKGA